MSDLLLVKTRERALASNTCLQLVECHGDDAIRRIDRDHRAPVLDDLPEYQQYLLGRAGLLEHTHADRDALVAHRLLLHSQSLLEPVLVEHPELDGAGAIGAEHDPVWNENAERSAIASHDVPRSIHAYTFYVRALRIACRIFLRKSTTRVQQRPDSAATREP